jgi:hypothetical protein
MPSLQRHRDCAAVPVVFRKDFQKELTTGRAGLYNGALVWPEFSGECVKKSGAKQSEYSEDG